MRWLILAAQNSVTVALIARVIETIVVTSDAGGRSTIEDLVGVATLLTAVIGANGLAWLVARAIPPR